MDNKRQSLFRIYGTIFAVILLLAFLPLISALGASYIADAAGCRLDEAGTYPCPVFGRDIGEDLTFFFVLGWAGMLTLPAGVAAIALWAIALIVHIALRYFRSSK